MDERPPTFDEFAAWVRSRREATWAGMLARLDAIAAGEIVPDQAALPPSQRMDAFEAQQQADAVRSRLRDLDNPDPFLPVAYQAHLQSGVLMRLGIPLADPAP